MSGRIFLILLGLCFSAPSFASGPLSTRSLGVDLRDLVRWAPTQLPYLRAVFDEMKTSPGAFFPRGVHFDEKGVRSEEGTDRVFGVYLAKEPVIFEADSAHVLLFSVVQSGSLGSFIRFHEVEIGLGDQALRKVAFIRDVRLSHLRFKVDVALYQRKAIIREETLGLQMVYPLGVGGFDEGVSDDHIKLKTPLFRNAALKRGNPTFEGHPFISIHGSKGTKRTPFGLHAEPSPQFSRGFLSHGCLRVRLKDLYELNLLIEDQGAQYARFDVHRRLDGMSIHPYPVLNDQFQTVVNCGSADRPKTCKDEKGLTQMRRKRGLPPVHLLSSL